MQARVENIADALLNFEQVSDPVENLTRFLQADSDFLGVVLSLANLSQEKFLRILSAERFAKGDFGREWGRNAVYNRLKHEEGFAERIAHLFLDGHNSPLLVQQVAAFYLNQLALPENWSEIIQDEAVIQNVIRSKLSGEYSDKKGDAIETLIREKLDDIEQKYGVSHSKGQIHFLGKEVDHAIPSTEDTWVMIMSSYMETTSSSQTARANEQREMYLRILNENMRFNTKRVFVNFVDGAGWLTRRSDLRKLHASCDYILNLKTLDTLETIICRYVPEKYFKNQSRPEVVEE